MNCRVVMISASKNQGGREDSHRLVSCAAKGQIRCLSPCIFHLACTWFLSPTLLFAGFLFNVVGIFEYQTDSEATSHRKPGCSKLGSLPHLQSTSPLTGSKEGISWYSWHEHRSDPKEQHSMNKRQEKIVFILNPPWKGHVIY